MIDDVTGDDLYNSRQFRQSVTYYDDDEFYLPENEMTPQGNQEPQIPPKKLTRAELIFEMARNWKPIERNDDYRAPDAAKEGGFILNDPEVLAKFRSALRDLIS